MQTDPDGRTWFSEVHSMWPGQAMRIEVDKVLFEGKSKYQDILVFDSKTWGRVFVLDGAIQVTTRDEFAYQEMLAHLPLMAHPNPKCVLVIGGGDGGVLREIVKHPGVEEVVICEIDEMVMSTARKFLPELACGLDSPRVTVHVGDGLAFLKEHTNHYDVIITDSSDPDGPAETLFSSAYYALVEKSLSPGGIMACQGESMYIHLDLIKSLMIRARASYPNVSYAWTHIPTYPCGSIGFVIGCKDKSVALNQPNHPIPKEVEESCRYYSREIHSASFVLPAFADRVIHALD